MQNLMISLIIVLAEMIVIILAVLFFIYRGRRRMDQRLAETQTQELKLLAHQLVQTHEALMKQYHVCRGEDDGAAIPEGVTAAVLKKAIEQLRGTAALLAGGGSLIQVGRDLLEAQGSLLPAFERISLALTSTVVDGGEEEPSKPPESAFLPAVKTEETPAPFPTHKPSAVDPLDLLPIVPQNSALDSSGEPLTKTDSELQAEIDALLLSPPPDE